VPFNSRLFQGELRAPREKTLGTSARPDQGRGTAYGTKPTSQARRLMSASEGKADIPRTDLAECLLLTPKPTSPIPAAVIGGTPFALKCDNLNSPRGLSMRMPMRRRELILSFVGGVAGCSFIALAIPAKAQMQFPPEGSNLTFALTATDGTSVTEQNYRGKCLVIYFGYTFCPDVCPTTMMEIGGALKTLGPRADMVQGLFITVDPQRDTPAVLNDYLRSFDPRLIGLTGTPAQIAAAAKAFHVFYERNSAGDGSYLYDHSSYIYFVYPDGKFAKAITSEGGGQAVADALSVMMSAAR